MYSWHKAWMLAIALTPFLSSQSLLLAADDDGGEDLYSRIVKSSVFIQSKRPNGLSMGSGSLIDAERKIILTNYHVVHNNDTCWVQFPVYDKSGTMLTDKKKYFEFVRDNVSTYVGKVMYRDKHRDLALVYLKSLPPGTKALKIAEKSVSPGMTVWNIGNAGNDELLFGITKGDVRSVGYREFPVRLDATEMLFIKAKMVCATNPTNPGESGGPMFNKRGELVAVTQGGAVDAQGVNTFVDIAEVKAFLAEKKIDIKDASGQSTVQLVTSKTTTTTPDPKKELTLNKEKQEKDAKNEFGILQITYSNHGGEESKKERYVTELKQFIVKYSGTKAASDAKKILDGLN